MKVNEGETSGLNGGNEPYNVIQWIIEKSNGYIPSANDIPYDSIRPVLNYPDDIKKYKNPTGYKLGKRCMYENYKRICIRR